MLAQRGVGVAARATKPVVQPPSKSESQGTPSPAAPKRKLSFKEKHALDTFGARMEKLSTEIAALEGKLADSTLFTRDAAAFNAAGQRLATLLAERAAAEEQWLELEMLREELEAL
jgi:ABC transport system ATP-binding/permease protein